MAAARSTIGPRRLPAAPRSARPAGRWRTAGPARAGSPPAGRARPARPGSPGGPGQAVEAGERLRARSRRSRPDGSSARTPADSFAAVTDPRASSFSVSVPRLTFFAVIVRGAMSLPRILRGRVGAAAERDEQRERRGDVRVGEPVRASTARPYASRGPGGSSRGRAHGRSRLLRRAGSCAATRAGSRAARRAGSRRRW